MSNIHNELSKVTMAVNSLSESFRMCMDSARDLESAMDKLNKDIQLAKLREARTIKLRMEQDAKKKER